MNDLEIREELCAFIDSRYRKVRIMDEIVIGNVRADIVTVTDCLTGYEIKGDADSYTRLPGQVKEYDRHFQQNYLVVGQSHRKSAAARIPPYWGILCVSLSEDGVEIEELREPSPNPKFSLRKQLALLWKSELMHILHTNRYPRYPHKSKAFKRRFLLETMDHDALQQQICEELFERDWTVFG